MMLAHAAKDRRQRPDLHRMVHRNRDVMLAVSRTVVNRK